MADASAHFSHHGGDPVILDAADDALAHAGDDTPAAPEPPERDPRSETVTIQIVGSDETETGAGAAADPR